MSHPEGTHEGCPYRGARLDARGRAGRTALGWAIAARRPWIIETLREAGAAG